MLPHVWDQMDQPGRDFFFLFLVFSTYHVETWWKPASTAVSREELVLLGGIPLSLCVYFGGDADSRLPLCSEVELVC